MAFEIERKYLVKTNLWKKKADKGEKIKQGYLSFHPNRNVRIRIKGKKAYLTIKGKTKNITRQEFEYQIPIKEARKLIKMCKKPIIEKTRFELRHNGLVWEIDQFEGANKGLVVAELELENENKKIHLPKWVGKEVSSKAKYYNANLAKKPFSKW